MTYPLPQDDDGLIAFDRRARHDRRSSSTNADVLAIGPGLGQSDELRQLVRWVVETVRIAESSSTPTV